MYTKTNWVDNTTPINETNLNKIEQGIYDNSLVVDAVTNTLNPTDTETYKTAELTEGQITDVIGVNDIIIKGQTEQDGTPTPSAPVDVNVVSGSNVINTSNKNLLSLPNGTYSYNNVTAIVNKGIITINGTPSSTPALLQISLTQPIKLKQNDSIKINVNNLNGIGTSSNFVSFRLSGTVNGVSNDNITDIVCTNTNANKTFTATNDTTINQVVIRGNTNVTFNNFIIKPQIELGTTTTPYESHQGKELPLDLPVENLFDSTLNTNTIGGVSINYNNDGSITLNGTATSNETKYVFSKYPSETSMCKLKANTAYTASIQKTSGTGVFNGSSEHSSIQFWQPWNYSFQMFFDDILKSDNTPNQIIITKTPTQETDLKNIQLSIRSGDVFNNFTIRVQFEQSPFANAYTPYGTEPIELCKIGNYQDYFYKSGSKWYLHKETGKVVLDGSETWVLTSTYTNNTRFSSYTLLGTNNKLISNYFVEGTGGTDTTNIDTNASSSQIMITIPNSIANTLDSFKNWLSNNNVIVYYSLTTVTNTEITGTLKEQLEAIYNAPLYEETNITQTNNDLPMILDITACKDNINGIKAFIRK